ncbi:MAG: sulfite exporter TauE/SafE family protein [Betaproteobacteria bacterium]|nr:sulfite exporter TauE/SafE family protein [Betaproteobacteria bacterium]
MQYFTVAPFFPDMPLDAEILVFAPLIVLAAYVIFGVGGFGSTLVAVPLLAHLFPLKFAIPVVVLLDGVASVSQGIELVGGADRDVRRNHGRPVRVRRPGLRRVFRASRRCGSWACCWR